jgi:hypothetical protein
MVGVAIKETTADMDLFAISDRTQEEAANAVATSCARKQEEKRCLDKQWIKWLNAGKRSSGWMKSTLDPPLNLGMG